MGRVILLALAALALLDGELWEAVGILVAVLVLVAAFPPGGRRRRLGVGVTVGNVRGRWR